MTSMVLSTTGCDLLSAGGGGAVGTIRCVSLGIGGGVGGGRGGGGTIDSDVFCGGTGGGFAAKVTRA